MTNKEAIFKLIEYRRQLERNFERFNAEPFDMAIKALEQQPCEDCISRAWLKESLHNFYHGLKHTPTEEDIQAYIDVAPSVTPQPKVGEWLEKEVIDNSHKVIEEWQSARCSVCDRYHTTPYMYYFDNYKFCPNCGAQMEKEAET